MPQTKGIRLNIDNNDNRFKRFPAIEAEEGLGRYGPNLWGVIFIKYWRIYWDIARLLSLRGNECPTARLADYSFSEELYVGRKTSLYLIYYTEILWSIFNKNDYLID